ncbi:MAG: hypothetical protein CM1200mP35_09280 [Chloroflexota bacterium]|nr:MAG: hypothetical protein CM1200mP35_09280 [Chloroflexota bacterium]
MGGKNAVILLSDADLEKALRALYRELLARPDSAALPLAGP